MCRRGRRQCSAISTRAQHTTKYLIAANSRGDPAPHSDPSVLSSARPPAVLPGQPRAVRSGVQFGRRDDDRGRKERGELFGGAEQGPYALGVLSEVGGVLVSGRLVLGPPGDAL